MRLFARRERLFARRERLFARREPHTLAGAYAMDALEPGDRTRFERHLARCDSCAQEVSELRETTARLATASAAPPPVGMKQRVMAAAHGTRQHAPATAPKKQLTTRRVVLIAAPATAALIAVATIFGLANSDTSQRLDQAQQRDQAIAAVLTAKDARMMSAQVAGGGMDRIVMSPPAGGRWSSPPPDCRCCPRRPATSSGWSAPAAIARSACCPRPRTA